MIPHSRPTLGREEKRACLRVLDSLQIAQGKQVEAFEKRFCDRVGRRYAIAVNSGTTALSLALRVLGVGEGDKVIVPSFSCAALLHAIDSVRGKAVPVDIELEDYNISVSHARKSLSPGTRAIIAPHIFGRAGRIKELLRLGVPVIEDGTQALGAHVGKKEVGSFGAISVFSFYATKMITTGEGGILLTDSKRLAKKLFDLRDYDKKKDYRFRTNSKMTDFQAAIGIEQLKKLSSFVRQRRKIAGCYHQVFRKFKVSLPTEGDSREHVYFRYVVRIPGQSETWLKKLVRKGIDAKRPIFKPLHRYLGLSDERFPATVRAMKEACSIPIFPAMKRSECERVCQAIQETMAAFQK